MAAPKTDQSAGEYDIVVVGAGIAGLMASGILALQNNTLATKLDAWRAALSASIPQEPQDV